MNDQDAEGFVVVDAALYDIHDHCVSETGEAVCLVMDRLYASGVPADALKPGKIVCAMKDGDLYTIVEIGNDYAVSVLVQRSCWKPLRKVEVDKRNAN